MAIQSDHLREVQDAPEHGTPIANYVGPAALSPSPPTSSTAGVLPTQDKALSWAKRVAFALLGALMGTLISSVPLGSGWLGIMSFFIVIAGMWLGAAYIINSKSRYVQWGVIAVVFTFELVSTMGLSLRSYPDSATLANGASAIGLSYTIIAVGVMLLAGFAVVKSLPRWGLPFGLLLIAATGVGSWMFQYGVDTPIDQLDYNLVSSLRDWGAVLSLTAPSLLFLLYLLCRRRPGIAPPAVAPSDDKKIS